MSLSVLRPNGDKQYLTAGWGSSRHGQLGALSNSTLNSNRVPNPQQPPRPSARPKPSPAFTPGPIRISPERWGAVRKIALGNQHSVVLDASGRVFSMGSNRKDQLAGVDSCETMDWVDCTWNGTYVLQRPSSGSPWTLFATGSHEKGQLGSTSTSTLTSPGLRRVEFPFDPSISYLSEFACGSEHVLALITRAPSPLSSPSEPSLDTEVWAWGWNEHGNLGLGHTQDVVVPTRIWPQGGNGIGGRVVRVRGGCGTSWIVVKDGEPTT